MRCLDGRIPAGFEARRSRARARPVRDRARLPRARVRVQARPVRGSGDGCSTRGSARASRLRSDGSAIPRPGGSVGRRRPSIGGHHGDRHLVEHRHRSLRRRSERHFPRELAVGLRALRLGVVDRDRLTEPGRFGQSDRARDDDVVDEVAEVTAGPPATTCSESFVRGSNIVITMPDSRRPELMFCWTSDTLRSSCPSPSSA